MKNIIEAISKISSKNHVRVTEGSVSIVEGALNEAYPGGKPATGMDPRHYAPHGYSTFKFSNGDKAAEFVETWTRSGGIAMIGFESNENELYGRRPNTFVVYASPLNDFYGGNGDLGIQGSQAPLGGTLADFVSRED